MAGAASAQEAEIGEPLVFDRPAPRPDPANELRVDSTPTPAPVTATAPAPPAATPVEPSGETAVASAAAVAVTGAPTSVTSHRATSVQGIQIQRPEIGSVATEPLARTGVNNHVLVVVAVALLVLGNTLIRSARPRRTL